MTVLAPTMELRLLQFKNTPSEDEIELNYAKGGLTKAQVRRELTNATFPKLQQKFLGSDGKELWVDVPLIVLPHGS